MARVGLAYSIFAPVTGGGDGAPMEYGTPLIFNHPIEANVSYERSDNPLYGGNVVAENDNGIVGGTLTFGNKQFTPAERAVMLGHKKKGTAPNEHYVETDASSPDGGFWYVTTEKENGASKWYAYWVYKTQLAMNEDNAKTKEKSVEWQTPVLEGPIMGVYLDDSGEIDFRGYQSFDTYAAAKAWVDAAAGVTGGGG